MNDISKGQFMIIIIALLIAMAGMAVNMSGSQDIIDAEVAYQEAMK